VTTNPHRLPRHAVPQRYEIRLEPALDAATFAGSQIVTLDISDPTSEIVLNAAELDIYEAHLRNDADDHVEAVVTYDEEAQRATLTLDQQVEPGEWKLFCGFTGILNDQLHGFYRSTFTDIDGDEQVIATTQFEAADARRAFPCWDEPDFKAVFAITLVVPEDLLAVSNGAEVERSQIGDKVAIRFADTMKMSTYIVAFVVGPFEATEARDVDGVPLRVIVPRGKLHLTDYAMQCGDFCLRYLSSYYGIDYPGDKVDMVAIPDFAFGAMENLGCITYRETALLIDLANSTQAERLRILDVAGHELAHMWFGDLVTMKWWNGIWLNEAFASFLEMKATDAMRPDWKRWLAFAAVERPWAFEVDDLVSTRPVEFEVNSPDEANEMFDALTYGKGSAVLRMIEQYLGEEVFRQGVGSYLRTHSYGNTEAADLWAALNQASGIPVGEIMDTWILQGGYPQVDVDLEDGGIRLRQRRFLAEPDEADQTLWRLPIQVRGSVGGVPFDRRLIMDSDEAFVEVPGQIDWVVANGGGHGFYRTSYSDSLFVALTDDLDKLDDLERYTLIDDSWAFVENGQLNVADFLALVEGYRAESEHAIWQSIIGALGKISHHLVEDDHRPAFRTKVTSILNQVAARLGWDPADDDDLTRRMRGQVLQALGLIAEDQETIQRAREVFTAWSAEPSSIDPDVAQAAMFIVARHGDGATYEEFMRRHKSASSPMEEQKFLRALTTFGTTALTDRTITNLLDGTIRAQDVAWVTGALLGNRTTGAYAWELVRRNWDDLVEAMPPATRRRLVDGLPALSEPAVAANVQAFLAEHPLPGVAKGLEQKLERLRAMVAMRQRERDRLSEALN